MSNSRGKTCYKVDAKLLLIIFCAFVLYKNFNAVGLWLDETVSYWIIKDGFSASVERSLEFQGQSPLYYVILGKFTNLFGLSESTLRLPSLICLFLSALFLLLLSRKYFSTLSSLFVVAVFLSSDAVLVTLSARPYAMALMFSLFACLALVNWLRNSKLTWLIIYSMSFTLSLYAHYLFVGTLCVHLAIFIFSQKSVHATATKFIGAILIAIAWLVPLYTQAIHIFDKSKAWSFAAEPGLTDLTRILFPAPIIIAALLAFCLGWVSGGKELKWNWLNTERNSFAIFLIWYLLWPLILFGYSLLFTGSLFIERYCLLYVPGLALCLGALLECIGNGKVKNTIALGFIAFIFIREMDKTWAYEGWEQAANIVNTESATPVLLYPGLIEASNVENFLAEKSLDYLSAPLQYYKVKNAVNTLPLITGSSQNEELAIKLASKQKEFFFVYLNKRFKGNNISGLYNEVFRRHGLNVLPIAKFGFVGVDRVSSAP